MTLTEPDLTPTPETAPVAASGLPSLTRHPEWAPLSGTLRVGGGWTVRLWEEPRLPGDVGLDTTLIVNHGPTLRLAVMDAAENKMLPDSQSRALRATHTVRGWLRAEPDLTTALAGASRELCDPTLPLRQRNPLATVAVLDVDRATGRATATRCADSEVWVRRGTEWAPVFPGHMLAEDARVACDTARATLHGRSGAAWWAIQEVLLDDPACWLTPPIGFEPAPRPETVDLGSIDEVIVTTDGSRLTPDLCPDLAAWLTDGIQQFPSPDWPHPSPHGDLAVLHLTRHTA